MLIDSTRQMYAAFMEARWAMPATGSLLVVLDDVLDVTIQQQALVVTVPDVWLTRVDDFARHLVFAGPKRPAIGPLAGSNEDLFTLVRTATTELRRLWSIQATEAVRALGHVMSRDARLLSHPGRKRGDSAEGLSHPVATSPLLSKTSGRVSSYLSCFGASSSSFLAACFVARWRRPDAAPVVDQIDARRRHAAQPRCQRASR
jgi:hypothetical protein